MKWITCEDTFDEVWRRLLEYANIELTVEQISKKHGTCIKSNKSNYTKQAQQIRVSLLQAKEYFEAAKKASLFTKPNLLYYGIVSLSTASMLINGDGNKSLDNLRKDKKNAHHGLDFTFSSDINNSKIGLRLLENSYVKICKNGHFMNWYSTLKGDWPAYALMEKSDGIRKVSNYSNVGIIKIPKIEKLLEKKSSVINIIKTLPDLVSDVERYGIIVDYARGEHTRFVDIKQEMIQDVFTFHDSPSYETLISIANIFETTDIEKPISIEIDINNNEKSGFIRTKKCKSFNMKYPDFRDSLDHKRIFYKEDISMPEEVDLFLISYSLSMLSRYFPDIWISFLESHCKGAKLIEQVVNLLYRKVPNLMLNQITGENYIISTHQPSSFK